MISTKSSLIRHFNAYMSIGMGSGDWNSLLQRRRMSRIRLKVDALAKKNPRAFAEALEAVQSRALESFSETGAVSGKHLRYVHSGMATALASAFVGHYKKFPELPVPFFSDPHHDESFAEALLRVAERLPIEEREVYPQPKSPLRPHGMPSKKAEPLPDTNLHKQIVLFLCNSSSQLNRQLEADVKAQKVAKVKEDPRYHRLKRSFKSLYRAMLIAERVDRRSPSNVLTYGLQNRETASAVVSSVLEWSERISPEDQADEFYKLAQSDKAHPRARAKHFGFRQFIAKLGAYTLGSQMNDSLDSQEGHKAYATTKTFLYRYKSDMGALNFFPIFGSLISLTADQRKRLLLSPIEQQLIEIATTLKANIEAVNFTDEQIAATPVDPAVNKGCAYLRAAGCFAKHTLGEVDLADNATLREVLARGGQLKANSDLSEEDRAQRESSLAHRLGDTGLLNTDPQTLTGYQTTVFERLREHPEAQAAFEKRMAADASILKQVEQTQKRKDEMSDME